MGNKPGPKSKDKAITDNFNRKKKATLGPRKLSKLAKEQAEISRLLDEQRERELREKAASLQSVKDSGLEVFDPDNPDGAPPAPLPDEVPDDVISALGAEGESKEDIKSAYQMLQDMRYAYRKLGGKTRLIKAMKDDKSFATITKELLKVEVALMTANLRVKGNGNGEGNKAVFVVLKGLEDGPKMAVDAKGPIDIKQIRHVLDPEAEKYVGKNEEEEVKVDGPEGW